MNNIKEVLSLSSETELCMHELARQLLSPAVCNQLKLRDSSGYPDPQAVAEAVDRFCAAHIAAGISSGDMTLKKLQGSGAICSAGTELAALAMRDGYMGGTNRTKPCNSHVEPAIFKRELLPVIANCATSTDLAKPTERLLRALENGKYTTMYLNHLQSSSAPVHDRTESGSRSGRSMRSSEAMYPVHNLNTRLLCGAANAPMIGVFRNGTDESDGVVLGIDDDVWLSRRLLPGTAARLNAPDLDLLTDHRKISTADPIVQANLAEPTDDEKYWYWALCAAPLASVRRLFPYAFGMAEVGGHVLSLSDDVIKGVDLFRVGTAERVDPLGNLRRLLYDTLYHDENCMQTTLLLSTATALDIYEHIAIKIQRLSARNLSIQSAALRCLQEVHHNVLKFQDHPCWLTGLDPAPKNERMAQFAKMATKVPNVIGAPTNGNVSVVDIPSTNLRVQPTVWQHSGPDLFEELEPLAACCEEGAALAAVAACNPDRNLIKLVDDAAGLFCTKAVLDTASGVIRTPGSCFINGGSNSYTHVELDILATAQSMVRANEVEFVALAEREGPGLLARLTGPCPTGWPAQEESCAVFETDHSAFTPGASSLMNTGFCYLAPLNFKLAPLWSSLSISLYSGVMNRFTVVPKSMLEGARNSEHQDCHCYDDSLLMNTQPRLVSALYGAKDCYLFPAMGAVSQGYNSPYSSSYVSNVLDTLGRAIYLLANGDDQVTARNRGLVIKAWLEDVKRLQHRVQLEPHLRCQLFPQTAAVFDPSSLWSLEDLLNKANLLCLSRVRSVLTPLGALIASIKKSNGDSARTVVTIVYTILNLATGSVTPVPDAGASAALAAIPERGWAAFMTHLSNNLGPNLAANGESLELVDELLVAIKALCPNVGEILKRLGAGDAASIWSGRTTCLDGTVLSVAKATAQVALDPQAPEQVRVLARKGKLLMPRGIPIKADLPQSDLLGAGLKQAVEHLGHGTLEPLLRRRPRESSGISLGAFLARGFHCKAPVDPMVDDTPYDGSPVHSSPVELVKACMADPDLSVSQAAAVLKLQVSTKTVRPKPYSCTTSEKYFKPKLMKGFRGTRLYPDHKPPAFQHVLSTEETGTGLLSITSCSNAPKLRACVVEGNFSTPYMPGGSEQTCSFTIGYILPLGSYVSKEGASVSAKTWCVSLDLEGRFCLRRLRVADGNDIDSLLQPPTTILAWTGNVKPTKHGVNLYYGTITSELGRLKALDGTDSVPREVAELTSSLITTTLDWGPPGDVLPSRSQYLMKAGGVVFQNWAGFDSIVNDVLPSRRPPDTRSDCILLGGHYFPTGIRGCDVVYTLTLARKEKPAIAVSTSNYLELASNPENQGLQLSSGSVKLASLTPDSASSGNVSNVDTDDLNQWCPDRPSVNEVINNTSISVTFSGHDLLAASCVPRELARNLIPHLARASSSGLKLDLMLDQMQGSNTRILIDRTTVTFASSRLPYRSCAGLFNACVVCCFLLFT